MLGKKTVVTVAPGEDKGGNSSHSPRSSSGSTSSTTWSPLLVAYRSRCGSSGAVRAFLSGGGARHSQRATRTCGLRPFLSWSKVPATACGLRLLAASGRSVAGSPWQVSGVSGLMMSLSMPLFGSVAGIVTRGSPLSRKRSILYMEFTSPLFNRSPTCWHRVLAYSTCISKLCPGHPPTSLDDFQCPVMAWGGNSWTGLLASRLLLSLVPLTQIGTWLRRHTSWHCKHAAIPTRVLLS